MQQGSFYYILMVNFYITSVNVLKRKLKHFVTSHFEVHFNIKRPVESSLFGSKHEFILYFILQLHPILPNQAKDRLPALPVLPHIPWDPRCPYLQSFYRFFSRIVYIMSDSSSSVFSLYSASLSSSFSFFFSGYLAIISS